ncbi:hypothetical protein L1281_001399 [Neisseria sp. HSC-16F19]|nr:hypothetical protein [Neisseria sp. HSC-16F19]MCP2040809.1 hypothetical protein [Neisseria sp. HSC-16F19]
MDFTDLKKKFKNPTYNEWFYGGALYFTEHKPLTFADLIALFRTLFPTAEISAAYVVNPDASDITVGKTKLKAGDIPDIAIHDQTVCIYTAYYVKHPGDAFLELTWDNYQTEKTLVFKVAADLMAYAEFKHGILTAAQTLGITGGPFYGHDYFGTCRELWGVNAYAVSPYTINLFKEYGKPWYQSYYGTEPPWQPFSMEELQQAPKLHLQGYLRHVYGFNLLSPAHLALRVGGTSLAEWIKANPKNGVLTTYDWGAAWEVDSTELLRVQQALWQQGILIAVTERSALNQPA